VYRYPANKNKANRRTTTRIITIVLVCDFGTVGLEVSGSGVVVIVVGLSLVGVGDGSTLVGGLEFMGFPVVAVIAPVLVVIEAKVVVALAKAVDTARADVDTELTEAATDVVVPLFVGFVVPGIGVSGWIGQFSGAPNKFSAP